MDHRLDHLTILIFDLEPIMALDIEMVVERGGGTALVAHKPAEALALIEKTPNINCAIVHHSTSGRDGTDVRRELNRRGIRIITYTFALAECLGPQYGIVIERPATTEQIWDAVAQSLELV